ncbi:MAG: hypothetical protein O3C40_15975 [Planctomycetota bacterium]|nr:hypothetical protein [Planctomycetota bacterium]
MSKYLLPCECGKRITVDLSQAGQQIACECGQLLEIPTLRGVRELEPVQQTTSSARQSAEWDSSRGMVFAGSLILFVIGAAVSYFAYAGFSRFGYAGLRDAPNITHEVERESFDKAIDDMSLDETYEAWRAIREHGLGPRGQNVYVNIRSFRAGQQRLLTIGIVLCVVGMLGAIGSTLGRRKPSA